jgi:phosphopantetheine--protein transferase-like protein
VDQLLSNEVMPLISQPSSHLQPPIQQPGGFQIGVDVEQSDSLPETNDYRSHPFFQDNFTPGEISYCIQQSSARASFCGVWAAKEAAIKAGAASAGHSLKHIEITHDAAGKPGYTGCVVSISHSPSMAVAVCLKLGGGTSTPQHSPSSTPPTDLVAPARRWPWSPRPS